MAAHAELRQAVYELGDTLAPTLQDFYGWLTPRRYAWCMAGCFAALAVLSLVAGNPGPLVLAAVVWFATRLLVRGG